MNRKLVSWLSEGRGWNRTPGLGTTSILPHVGNQPYCSTTAGMAASIVFIGSSSKCSQSRGRKLLIGGSRIAHRSPLASWRRGASWAGRYPCLNIGLGILSVPPGVGLCLEPLVPMYTSLRHRFIELRRGHHRDSISAAAVVG